MCGRTVLSLNKKEIACACRFKSYDDLYTEPKWKDEYNDGREFVPSYNIAPGDITPVLMASKCLHSDETDRILKPMMWGLIPPWHEGDHKTHNLKTTNCRLENIENSKLFSPILKNGGRCIILAEGFYEWKTFNKVSRKQPYYIYAQHKQDSKANVNLQDDNMSKKRDKYENTQLLHLAGLYNVWKKNNKTIYSYCIITMESSTELSWLHHRMPAILDTDEQIMAWLSIDKIDSDTALSFLQKSNMLRWHPVSTMVNNSSNKMISCIQKLDPAASKCKQSLLDTYIQKRKSSSSNDEVKKKGKFQ